jgi:hypothetical protein
MAVLNVDNDPERIPVESRMHLLRLALEAVQHGLAEADIHGLDFFGRIELLALALNDAEEHYRGQLPALREN